MYRSELELVARAAHFAARAHAAQRRKDAGHTPYINHLTEVAHLLAAAGSDAALIAAGYLHDTIEDVSVTYEVLVAEFDHDIAGLVLAVSDDKSLVKERRKELQVEHAATAPPRVAALKIADKISNLRSLGNTPPAGWPPDRIREYIDWAHRVVTALRIDNEYLLGQYQAARSTLLDSGSLAAAHGDPPRR